MTIYTASNGAIIADLTTLKAIPSTNLPATGFVILFVAFENSWYEYNSALTSGDIIPINNPSSGRWIRIGSDKLTTNRIYYVRPDGSDSNNGLANTSSGAFLTIPKAIDVVTTIDLGGYNLTIKLADGTYNANIILKSIIGGGVVTIEGNTTTPTNVIVTSLSGNTISSSGYDGRYEIKGFRIQSSGISVYLTGKGIFDWGLIDFAASSVHLGFENFVIARPNNSYTISGGAAHHFYATNGAQIRTTDPIMAGKVCTISGSPTFSFFVYCAESAQVNAVSSRLTFSGAATGSRYFVLRAGQIITNSATIFAGDAAGTVDTATYGIYV